MSTCRDFHLGDVLSITTGILLPPNGIKGCYDILNYLSGDSLFTHQLPRVAGEMKPVILEQHPELSEVCVSSRGPEESWDVWLARQVDRFGPSLSLSPAPSRHLRVDPAKELGAMIGDDKAVIVEVERGEL